jgi:hypothetical protein
MKVEGLPPFRCMLDTSTYTGVLIPESLMPRLSGKRGTKNLDVTAMYGNIPFKMDATSWPDKDIKEVVGVLGMNILMKYHVVLDYRDKMLYLEPPV